MDFLEIKEQTLNQIFFWSQLKSRWLAQLINLRKHRKDCGFSAFFTDTEPKLNVAVAETDF